MMDFSVSNQVELVNIVILQSSAYLGKLHSLYKKLKNWFKHTTLTKIPNFA